jgi:hypothetical protein
MLRVNNVLHFGRDDPKKRVFMFIFFFISVSLLYYFTALPSGRTAWKIKGSRSNFPELVTDVTMKLSTEEKNDKWIVVTTINYPTPAIQKLAKIDGWKVVVVGDKKTPKGWNYTNCVYLGVEKQKELGYKIYDLLPYGHYGRKNIGYIYAVQHGARVIYETDDDNMLIGHDLSTFYPDTATVCTLCGWGRIDN